MQYAFILLITWIGLGISKAQVPPEDWQEKVKRDYPEIGIKGSEKNEKYVARYKELKATNPEFFNHPEWPMRIAKEIYEAASEKPAMPDPAIAPAAKVPEEVVVRPSWTVKSGTFAGGSRTVADLKKLLGKIGVARKKPEPTEGEPICAGVTFLMSLPEAKEKLGVERQTPSKVKVACPGFPDGLFYYSFDGKFEGRYNRLYLVTDYKDKAVCIQLVEESPKDGSMVEPDLGWKTYNFVNARMKAKSSLRIYHHVTRGKVVIVDSLLYDPDQNRYLERVRWYAPQPLVDAILASVGS